VGLVALDPHAAAAAVALLPTPEFPVDEGQVDGQASREAGQVGDQGFSVRLTCCGKSQHNG